MAKVLEEAGLIEDWYSYNEYLVENGYNILHSFMVTR